MAGTSTGSTRWPTSDWPASSWQGLLRDAIRLLDTLKEPPTWTFGGGTALAVFYEHRISYDIDIFLPNADAVSDLSPARNPATTPARTSVVQGNSVSVRVDTGGSRIIKKK